MAPDSGKEPSDLFAKVPLSEANDLSGWPIAAPRDRQGEGKLNKNEATVVIEGKQWPVARLKPCFALSIDPAASMVRGGGAVYSNHGPIRERMNDFGKAWGDSIDFH